ncbi:hypothetical protein [Priestia sp. HNGD-A6]|uniref:hypothetical protein n=1 Tax=Priestia sp. HNGD-A6 TaxID=3092666 RepID=UPI0038927D36
MLYIKKIKDRSFRRFIYKKRKQDKLSRINKDKRRRAKKAKYKYLKYKGSNWNSQSFYNFLKHTPFANNKKIRAKINGDEATVKIPEVFSFMDNPDETISVYNLLYQISKNKQVTKVFIDHRNCKVLGLGASTVMDAFVMNLKNHKKQQSKKIQIHGRLPRDPYINMVLQVSGILKNLNIITDELDQLLEDTSGIEILDLVLGGKHSSTLKVSPQATSAEISTLISDYFNRCLQTQDYSLTDEGYALFCHMVGEVIDNCEIHSGDFCQWFTLGNYFIINKNEEYGECNLVLFNFGQTIYEGLKKHINSLGDNTTNKMAEQLKYSLEALTSQHLKKGFFGPNWNEEVLWTLYALQDGVSRCISEDEPDRGTGTVRLIEAFQEIGNTYDGKTSEMCIISGRAQIKFTGNYVMNSEMKENETRQIIAFNSQNDLNLPPDKKCVRLLKNHFPGTVISMKFYLDRKYFDDVLKEE